MKPISRESQYFVMYREKGSMPRRALGLRLPSVSVDPLKDTMMSCAIRLRRFSRPVVKQGLRKRGWFCASTTPINRVTNPGPHVRLSVCKACWAPHRNSRSERVWDNVVYTTARSFLPFLFLPTGVMRLDIFEAELCIVCRREKGSSWMGISRRRE